MALIGKIRNNMWMVILLLGVALAGFIIMDMTRPGSGGFGSQTTVGEINGDKVDYIEFQRMEEALYSGSGNVFNSRSAVWNYMVENSLLNRITEANGLSVGADELNELEFGNNLSPMVQSFFTNPQTGQVDRQQLNEVKEAIETGTVSNPDFAFRFNELRKQVIKNKKQEKLSNMVAKAIYTPTWYAEAMDKINNESASLEYVRVPFDIISDSEISVTDADYENYIKENAAKYTNKEETRNLSYVVIDVAPSKSDSIMIYNKILALKDEFSNTNNDSLFSVNNNGGITRIFVKKDDLPDELKLNIEHLDKGDVYGPYGEERTYAVAKIVDKKIEADSARASHILRTVENGDPIQLAAALKYVDSLKTAIQSGAMSFAEAALNNSQDPGSANDGGSLGSFAPGMMVSEFNDAVFNGKAGEMYTVTTQFGVHLIRVERLIYETNEMKYKVAYIFEPIMVSEKTEQELQDNALDLLGNTSSLEDLNAFATGGNTVLTAGGVGINDYTFGGLEPDQTTRDIVKWAFDKSTKPGKVSPTLYSITDKDFYVTSKLIVAGLKSVEKPGVASVESVMSQIGDIVKNQVKGEKIKSKIAGMDLASIAGNYDLKIDTVGNMTLGAPFFADGGSEPKVVGQMFASSVNTLAGPFIGNNGVYVGKLTSKNEAPADQGAFSQKAQLTQQARFQVNMGFMDALRSTAKIKDNRFNFF